MNERHLENFLTHLQTIVRFLRSSTHEEFDHPLTRLQWLLLRKINIEDEGCSIGYLADYLDIRHSTMSQMLDRLQKVKYIRRHQDPQDGRVKNKPNERRKGVIAAY